MRTKAIALALMISAPALSSCGEGLAVCGGGFTGTYEGDEQGLVSVVVKGADVARFHFSKKRTDDPTKLHQVLIDGGTLTSTGGVSAKAGSWRVEGTLDEDSCTGTGTWVSATGSGTWSVEGVR